MQGCTAMIGRPNDDRLRGPARLTAARRDTAGLLGGQFGSQRFGAGQQVCTNGDRLADQQIGQFGGNGTVDGRRDHDRLCDEATDQSTRRRQFDRNEAGKCCGKGEGQINKMAV